MAIAEVGAGSQRANANSTTNVTALTKAFPANITAGNYIIIAGSFTRSGGGSGVDSLTLSAGTATIGTVTFTQGGINSNTGTFIAFAKVTGTGSATISANVSSGTAWITLTVDEFSGIHATVPTDVDGGNSTGTGTSVADSITTVAADALVIGVCTWRSSTSNTAPGGSWTEYGNVENWAVDGNHSAVFQVIASPGAQTITWTLGASAAWSAQTYSWAPVAAAGGSGVRGVAIIVG